MSRSCRAATCQPAVFSLMLLLVPFSRAQTRASLGAPAAGIAPSGDVLRAGHLGREIGDTLVGPDFKPRVKAAKLRTLSRSNEPVFIGPTTRSFFVPDPQRFRLEFMDHDVKRQPTAKQGDDPGGR
jgi:hypothetical protein